MSIECVQHSVCEKFMRGVSCMHVSLRVYVLVYVMYEWYNKAM